jgi:hypothetical protein
MDIFIDPRERRIFGDAPEAGLLLDRLGYFSRLSILFYLTSAKNIPFSGRLVQPVNLKGGHIFFRGTHILPLDKLALKYGNDAGGFLKRGTALGGRQMNTAMPLFSSSRFQGYLLWLFSGRRMRNFRPEQIFCLTAPASSTWPLIYSGLLR